MKSPFRFPGDRMLSKKAAHEIESVGSEFFENVMTRIREAVNLGIRHPSSPLAQKVFVEDEVLLAPKDEERFVFERFEMRVRERDGLPRRMIRPERNILNKAMHGATLFPCGIRRAISMTKRLRHATAFAADPTRGERERVKTTDEDITDEGRATQGERDRKGLRIGQRKTRSVHKNNTRYEVRVSTRETQAYHAAPVVKDEGNVAKAERSHELFDIEDALLKLIRIIFVLWFIGKAATDVIGNDDAIIISELARKVSVVEGPGRVSVKRKENGRVLVPFVEVVHLRFVRERQIRSFERIKFWTDRFELRYHSSPSIRQLSPLPIPSQPTASDFLRKPCSSAIAAVRGKETVPMLPSN